MEMANVLVPVEKIPRLTTEVVTTDPSTLYRKFYALKRICLQENGVGLAAVQIGLDDRMFIVKGKDDEFRYFLNTRYTPVGEDKFTSCEGCLSLPGRAFLVPRYQSVRIVGTEMIVAEGIAFNDVDFVESDALYTAVFQHEIDHCDGKLISEIGKEVRVRRSI